MEISQQGIDLIKSVEGFSATVYPDVAGNLTIGYGHMLKRGEHLTTVTAAQAEQLLRDDLRIAQDAVNKWVRVPLHQCEYDALVSFVYNVGPKNFQKSTMLRYINEQDFDYASDEFPKWNHSGGKVVAGLTNRRNREMECFLGQGYGNQLV